MKKMKVNSRKVFLALCILPFITTALSMLFLPDIIPVHYGADGVINRYGSKYEGFIIAAVTGMTGIMLWIIPTLQRKYAKGDEAVKKAESNAKVINYIGIATMVMFNIMQAAFLFSSYNEVKNTSATMSVDIYKVVGICMGIMLAVMGNFLPKCKRNGLVGVRTPWSMHSDEAWAMSQRSGGITMIITGILLLTGSCILNNLNVMILLCVLLVLMASACVYLSYVAFKKTEQAKKG